MTILLTLVLVYTILGGMVSIVITDYVQFVVRSLGLLVACGSPISSVGWDNLVQTVSSLQGEAGFHPFHEQGFGTTYVVWIIFTPALVSCAIWQTAVMRACSADSIRTVRRLYMWSSIGFLIRFLLPYFLGICAFAYAAQHATLRNVYLTDGAPAAPDVTLSALPVVLSQILPTGIIGIVAAGMLAAFMSTHDSYLLCWSCVLTQNVVTVIVLCVAVMVIGSLVWPDRRSTGRIEESHAE